MNSKFFKLALCLGLFAGVMNNPSLSMEDSEGNNDEIFGQQLLDANEAFEEQVKKSNDNLYENNIQVDLFRNGYKAMMDNESSIGLKALERMISETNKALKENDFNKMMEVFECNNQFLPKARSFYHDVYDSYGKIKDMFKKENQTNNACTQKFNEINEKIKGLKSQIEDLQYAINDLTEQKEQIKFGFIDCLDLIKKYQKEKGETVREYKEKRDELSNLTEKLKQQVSSIMAKYKTKTKELNDNLKQYNDVKSVAPKKKKRVDIGKNQNNFGSSLSKVNEEFSVININETKKEFGKDIFNSTNKIPSNQLNNINNTNYQMSNIFYDQINEDDNDININNEQKEDVKEEKTIQNKQENIYG